MTKSSPQVFVNYDFDHSFDEAKEFFDKTGILIIPTSEIYSGYAYLLFEAYGSDIIIPEGIEYIGEHAFDGRPITSIKLPDSVTAIGEFAFRNTKLTEVDLSKVTEIYEFAFTKTPITSIKLSPDLYHIDPEVFSGTELQSVIVSSTPAPRTDQYYPPENYFSYLSYDIDEAFDKDTVVILDGIVTRDTAEQLLDQSGTTVFIPEGVVGIDATAFAGMSVEKIILPDSLKTIGHSAFAGSQISEVVIPDSVADIGEGAFAGTPLVSVDLGKGIRSIGDYAFAGTQITNIRLPDSLKNIGEGAFTGTSLENVEVPQTGIEVGVNAFPEPVLPDPVFEFNEPMMMVNSETIQFDRVMEAFDPLTNPNPVLQSTVFETIEPYGFGISENAVTVIEPIDELQGFSTDLSSEFSEENLQADLVNSMTAPSEVLA